MALPNPYQYQSNPTKNTNPFYKLFNCFRHLTKLYDSIAKLKFIQEGNKVTKMARGMFAKDGEYVEFNANCDCGGQVEVYSCCFVELYYICDKTTILF